MTAPRKEDIVRGIRQHPALIDAHAHVGLDPAGIYTGSFPYCMSAESLAMRMELEKIDYSAVFPFIYSEYFSLRAFCRGVFRKDPASASLFPYRLENELLFREIYEVFPWCAGRLLPFACFDPGRRPRAQAEFLGELAARHPLFGLKTATSYLQSPITALLAGDQALLELAAREDVPFMLHSAVVPGDPWANVFEILKVVEARPDVRFAIAHTCRFDRRALDRAAGLDNCLVDLSAFHIHCLLAQQDHEAVAAKKDRFPADYRDHAGAMQQIAEAYPDTMIWGTDTPAHTWTGQFFNDKGEKITMSLPCGPHTEVAELRKLPADLRRRITYTNTQRFLFGN